MKRLSDVEASKRSISHVGLNHIFLPELVEAMELRGYADKEKICSIGDKLDGIFVLVTGKIKVYTILPNGKTMLIRFAKPPSLIGDVEWMADYPIQNIVESVGASSLLVISRSLMLEMELNNPAFLRFMIQTLSQKLYTLAHTSAMNQLYPVENRFASYLLSLLLDVEGNDPAEEIRTSTLVETAEMLGTSYRHLNRVINRLVEDKVLERTRGRVRILNQPRLKELANDNLYT
ncbi:transcriptional regulator [Paenibacillus psychroresistens]|uniref:Transcriptional regulator n=1 Tax=Paenibacillus psychroresistens TaxID=1778678 RepID=A0A6B8RV36_9BACL|nr:cyclic nucleotide-binding domain-containing protein [Paenibacillus psychroresistens]QGQ99639.1 transcriptional regulator [Paenibacillus psychroresistens]